jgi:toxin ParE1/3/4
VAKVNLSIVFRPAARFEFDAAGDWYETRRSGLGSSFAAAVQAILDRISTQPDFYPTAWNDVREAMVSGFPYCVYYREEPARVVVLSIFHTARDPVIWQRRA